MNGSTWEDSRTSLPACRKGCTPFASRRRSTIHSNFGNGGLAPAGSTPGALTYGTYDLAGNTREWMFNATDEGERFTFGGAWDGPRSFFNEPYVRPPFDRDASNGFRCVMLFDSDRYPAELDEPLSRRSVPDWKAVQPFSDDEYETWLQFLAYPDRPLDERVEKIVESSPHWRVEKIYEGDHLLSGFRKEMIRDSLAWLDSYLGPVERQ